LPDYGGIGGCQGKIIALGWLAAGFGVFLKIPSQQVPEGKLPYCHDENKG
jgi:hypothetical protein